MKFVQRPQAFPGRSALDPSQQVGSDCRWIDTGVQLGGNRLYFTDRDARVLGDMVGLVHPREVRRLMAELDAERERSAALEAELVEQQRRWEALDVIESEGFRARKKPGRPKQEATA